jgi:anti-sigma factor RsiW
VTRRSKKLACRDVVEQLTDYLDDALDEQERARIDRHLEGCDGCARALEQWREVVRLAGRLGDEDLQDLPDETRARLVAAFRQQPPAPD